MREPREIEIVFEPQEEGGFYVHSPDLPGLHTEGETLDDAEANAREALSLYVEGLRESGELLGSRVVRRKLRIPE
jgi:predicted RNase H-like HicB family nuclease